MNNFLAVVIPGLGACLMFCARYVHPTHVPQYTPIFQAVIYLGTPGSSNSNAPSFPVVDLFTSHKMFSVDREHPFLRPRDSSILVLILMFQLTQNNSKCDCYYLNFAWLLHGCCLADRNSFLTIFKKYKNKNSSCLSALKDNKK